MRLQLRDNYGVSYNGKGEIQLEHGETHWQRKVNYDAINW